MSNLVQDGYTTDQARRFVHEHSFDQHHEDLLQDVLDDPSGPVLGTDAEDFFRELFPSDQATAPRSRTTGQKFRQEARRKLVKALGKTKTVASAPPTSASDTLVRATKQKPKKKLETICQRLKRDAAMKMRLNRAMDDVNSAGHLVPLPGPQLPSEESATDLDPSSVARSSCRNWATGTTH